MDGAANAGHVLGLYEQLVCQKVLTNGKLPAVLPIVLYNGKTRWNAPADLAALQTAAPPSLQPFQPALKYWLIDEGAQDVATLDRDNLATLIFSLENATPDKISDVISELIDRLSHGADTTLRRDFALFTCWLLRRKARKSRIPDMTDLAEVQNMLMERRLDWWEEWMNEGHAKGVVHGEATLLRRLLARRFGNLPPSIEARLTNATEEELIRWAEGVLEAKTLEQVFDSQ